MNIDITNIGHYRLTNSHGFVLFNRDTGAVHKISEDDYRFVKNLQTEARCKEVEYLYLKKVKIDV